MNKSEENYISHEVRLQLLEKLVEKFDKKFDKIEEEMKSQFHWLMTTILSVFGVTFLTVIAPMILSHYGWLK